MEKTLDSTIVAFAESTHEIIITHDLDFGGLMARSGKSFPSVILFRMQPITLHDYSNILFRYLPELELELKLGAFIVIENEHIRIRKLPF